MPSDRKSNNMGNRRPGPRIGSHVSRILREIMGVRYADDTRGDFTGVRVRDLIDFASVSFDFYSIEAEESRFKDAMALLTARGFLVTTVTGHAPCKHPGGKEHPSISLHVSYPPKLPDGASNSEDVDAVIAASGFEATAVSMSSYIVRRPGGRKRYEIRTTGTGPTLRYHIGDKKYFNEIIRNARTMQAALNALTAHLEEQKEN